MPSILWVNDNGTVSVVDVDDEGNRIDLPAPKAEPFGGNGDHDNNGTVGGAAPAVEPVKRKPGRPRKVN